MSPEQAEAKPVDERSDIFSLGVTLYELATGERPFGGDTRVAVLSAILKDTPKSVTDVNPAVPRRLARIIGHALVKDPDRRYQSAKDLRHDLEELAQAIESGEMDAPPQVRAARRGWRVMAAGLAAVAAVGAIAVWRRRTPAAVPTEAPPSTTHSRLTQMEGIERYPSLSPDGKWVVYASDGDIYLQSTTGQTAINLTKDGQDNTMPAFSPDGETIAFRSERDGGGIFLMGRTGESVRRLTAEGYDPAWFPDGRQVVFASAGPGGPREPHSLQRLAGGQREQWTTAPILCGRCGAAQRVAARKASRILGPPGGRRHEADGWLERGGEPRYLDYRHQRRATGPSHDSPGERLESHLVAGRPLALLFEQPRRKHESVAHRD